MIGKLKSAMIEKQSVGVWLFFAMERFWDGWDELENYMQGKHGVFSPFNYRCHRKVLNPQEAAIIDSSLSSFVL